MTGERDRRWLAEAGRSAAHEWTEYLRTVITVAREPAVFAREWADGERDALNPFYYLLNSAAIFVPWLIFWRHVAEQPGEQLPLWAQALQQASVFLMSLAWVLPGHFALRLLGGQRPLRTTFALFAYVFGGPLLLVALVSVPVSLLATRPGVTSGSPLVVIAWMTFGIWMLVFISYTLRVVTAAHRIAWWRGVVAIVTMHVSWVALHRWLAQHHGIWKEIL